MNQDKNELMLREVTKNTHQEILQKERRRQLPILIVIDGVDGVGKTSIVKNITQQIENDYQEKCIFNTFKRRREDKEMFKEAKIETEYMFRKEVVEQINRRIVEYPENANYVIIDKSPYSEYYYQRTPSFDRNIVSPYGNYKIEEEVFKYKEILDNAIVIFLENDKCWENYIGRENNKSG